MTPAGFPHSGITGSTPACGSPMLFAAYHALLRLSEPRHPPCALISLGRIFLSDPRKHFLHSCTHVRGRWSENHPPGTPIFLIPITRIVKLKIRDRGDGKLLAFLLAWGARMNGSVGRRLGSFAFGPKAYSLCSRKEVIQPQVPLRLPCYDFAPVTGLAFGRSLPCGLGHGLRALPTPMA